MIGPCSVGEAQSHWRWSPYFGPEEFVCQCGCGMILVRDSFMDQLVKTRFRFDKPMIVTSGYRCPTHNARVSKTGTNGPHTHGAADFAVRGEDALTLVGIAHQYGFTGIGVCQKGAARFIHLDDLPNADGQPRPWLWSY